MNQDQEHLRLLSIFHYVVGGLMALFALIPVFHMVLGLLFIISPETMMGSGGEPPPAFFGWLFFGIGSFLFLLGQATAVCVIVSGRFLAQRRRYMFSFVVACVQCLFVPFGTVLGIFTIVVLSRESVKALYA